MAQIIRSKGVAISGDTEEIPFVPAFDLLEQTEKRLSDEDIAAIAVALYAALIPPDESREVWERYSWIEGISGREP